MKVVGNPKYADKTKKAIILEIIDEEFGNEIVPFVASPNDSTEYGPRWFKECLEGKYGEVAEWEPPTVEEVLASVLGNRKEAYTTEADPLLAEYQFMVLQDDPKAEEKKKEWVEKVEEIKSRFPKPTGEAL